MPAIMMIEKIIVSDNVFACGPLGSNTSNELSQPDEIRESVKKIDSKNHFAFNGYSPLFS